MVSFGVTAKLMFALPVATGLTAVPGTIHLLVCERTETVCTKRILVEKEMLVAPKYT